MPFAMGDRVETSTKITAKTIELFAEVSGDYNPMHMDEEFAKTTRYGQRIAHGMISAALISKALAMHLGAGIYLQQTLKFKAPVFIGDVLTVFLHVNKVREERGMGFVETLVKNQKGEVVVTGDAVIMKAEFLGAPPEA